MDHKSANRGFLNLTKHLAIMIIFTIAMSTQPVDARPLSTPTDLYWPELKESHLKVGQFVDPRNIGRVVVGLPKREVRLLLNHPHFSEGLFDVREWDYVFNFLVGTGQQYIACQYKVLFDENMLVSSTHWQNQKCALYLKYNL